jgi:hypothetical protein
VVIESLLWQNPLSWISAPSATCLRSALLPLAVCNRLSGRQYENRPDGTIVMLTMFHKTRQHDQRQIDRAVRAQRSCEREHHRPAEQTYERQAG